MNTGIPIIISAPSGAGKTSLVSALVKAEPNLIVSISHTTRARRSGEINGVNYHFISEDEFHQMNENDGFLESAEVFGNHYGTSKQWVESQLANGNDVIFEIDWQGAKQLRRYYDNAFSIFILPPSLDTLRQRLINRNQDAEAVIEQRMQEAKDEIIHHDEFDCLIINDDFDVALNDLQVIIQACRIDEARKSEKLQRILANLLA